MLGKTHIAFALGIGAFVAVGFSVLTNTPLSLKELNVFYGGVTLGALLPDIDEPNSTIGKKTLGISNAIKALFGHRGLTHSITFIVGLGILLLVLSAFGAEMLSGIPLVSGFVKGLDDAVLEVFIFGILFGCVLHLMGDMLTPSGVPLLLPFSTRNFHLTPTFLRFKTGGIWDYAVGVFSLGIFSVLNAYYFGFHF
ncbi:metal-dependent hydrolase [Helicobacter turcicus]|uniref:Metal-dependent hydrolase n=1 Tax=Helicobacter turcicus TaxID=2867412 RepID=A0ABS7JMR2_9HELI|nr:metal-dependent hydrolase [Helicobacter turcicus]MBX7490671.1 metal-dependent hydrolase [Helicobacter turcicus]MBX7545421.1 metal-dependent hydrolase [Helicobacter turcicus]